MAVGIQGVQLQRVESLDLSAAGEHPLARGPFYSQDAAPQPEHGTGGVSVEGTKPNRGTSPLAVFNRAVRLGPMTREDRSAFRSQLAQVAAQDEIRRSPVSPQGDLLEAA